MEDGVNPEVGYGYSDQYSIDIINKMRDLEEKQRILKERLILIGQNLIEIREKTSQNTSDIKKDIEIMKQQIDRIVSFSESISGEFSRFARKEDLEILTKQAKMFQPLEFVRKKDIEKIKRN